MCSGRRSRRRPSAASRASSSPTGPQAQVSRSARSGTSCARSAGVEHARRCRCAARRAGCGRSAPARAARRRRSRRPAVGRGVHEDDVGEPSGRLRSMPMTGVMPLAGGDEQHLGRQRLGQHELARPPGRAARCVPGRALADQVVADHAVGDRLHGDGDAAVGPAGARGDRVGAPLADAVDVDADADVLAGDVRPRQPRPGRITRVTASPVSGCTATIRPRRLAPERSGSTRSR